MSCKAEFRQCYNKYQGKALLVFAVHKMPVHCTVKSEMLQILPALISFIA